MKIHLSPKAVRTLEVYLAGLAPALAARVNWVDFEVTTGCCELNPTFEELQKLGHKFTVYAQNRQTEDVEFELSERELALLENFTSEQLMIRDPSLPQFAVISLGPTMNNLPDIRKMLSSKL